MSEQDKGYTSVLLPGARISLFTRDGETRESLSALKSDWRFARVVCEIHEGNIDTAIDLYGSNGSPDLVIVQTDSIEGDFSEKLEKLGSSCAEGTAAIVIGPVNDVNLYRKFIAMGISDYLVRPVHAAALADNIAATLIARLGAAGSRMIAFLGAKGGVGTTTLAEATAWGVCERLGQKTFLMDAAGGWSSLSVGMNFEPSTTLAEAIRASVENNTDSFSRMLFNAGEKLTVLSSGGDVMLEDLATPEGYEILIDNLMKTYPVLVIDLSASNPAMKRTVLSRAHEIVLVTIPTLPAIRAARSLLHEIKDLRGGNAEGCTDVIVNMAGLSSKHEVSKAQIEEGLERKVTAFIPFDPPLFFKAESEGKKLSDDKDGVAVVEKILPLARKVLVGTGSESASSGGGAEEKKKGGLGMLLSKRKIKS